ncbi:MAG: hypothetical protein E5Y10_24520 [Mesorhizobium sp.]|nr:MAG: hypothetical protein E5Y10_24520 [Mesorhizobium sp.]
MKLSAILEPLIAAGVPGDVLLATVRAFEEQTGAAAEEGKEKARERWRRWKNKQGTNVCQRLQTDTNVSQQLVRVEDSSLKEDISKEERKKDSAAKPRGDLDAFKSELSSILDSGRIEALVAVRRKKGATFSAHAGSLLASALKACPDPKAAADEMVLRNWTGIKPEWLESRATPQHRSTAPPAETVGSLSKRQLFRQGPNDDAPDNSTGRVVQIDSGRLEGSPGAPRSFAISGNLLGRI